MEPLLSQEDLTSLREALHAELRRLVEATALAHRSPNRDDAAIGAGNPRDMQAISPARARARRIMDALRRIDDGTYGGCVRCRSAIPRLRLLSIPDTPYCLDCSWAHEFPQH
jgi:DnaK suppressor protein